MMLAAIVCLLLQLLLPSPAESYNVSGRWCHGPDWRRRRGFLWSLARAVKKDSVLALGRRESEGLAWKEGLHECPEGAVSAGLGVYARASREEQQAIVAELSEGVITHWSAPVLLWRLRQGGWPDFGAGHVLEQEVHRYRFPDLADLILDTVPRFRLDTPPAPWTIQQGWWWSQREASHEGMSADSNDLQEGSSLDLGMHVLLRRSPILMKRRGLLLIDVGAFDGNSLLSIGLQVDMGHKVLAFEPLASNRKGIIAHFMEKELLDHLQLVDPKTQECIRFNHQGMLSVPCACVAESSCATLARVGLSAANHSERLAAAEAHSSVTMQSYGGESYAGAPEKLEAADFIVGEPIVRWWVHSVLGLPCVDIHLLKIDVEGAEFAALRGLEPLLAEHRVRFLFLEVWPLAIMSWGTDPLGVLRWLAHYGFHCRFLGTHLGPETFEEFVARHSTALQMGHFGVDYMSFNDVLCEDLHWHDPCGWERRANEGGSRPA
mmetsp:Transcript_39693/g.125817  ORF Transcript_39693/g.125817 Transcript_39693/m.125817 type:complete len:491 (+) Transcript_39693:156-1628(+)